MKEVKKCPICGKEYNEHPAISRNDNKEICPDCGLKEALQAFVEYEKHANTLRKEDIEVIGGTIPITLSQLNNTYIVAIDGVTWLETENQTHAVIIFEMLKDHVTEYMNYRKL